MSTNLQGSKVTMPKSKNHGRFPCSIHGCFAVANHLSSMCRHKWGHLPQRLLPACRGHLANGLPCPVRYQGRADTMKRHWLTHHTNEGPWQPDRYPPFEDLWKLVKDGEIVLTPPSKYQASTTTDGEDDEPSVEISSSMTVTSLPINSAIVHDSGVGPIRRRRPSTARVDPLTRPPRHIMLSQEEVDEPTSPVSSTLDAPLRTRYPLLPAGNYNVIHPPLVHVPISHVREHHHQRHRRTSSSSTNATGFAGGLGLLSRAAATVDYPPLPPLIPEYTHRENDIFQYSKGESKPYTGNYVYGHKKGSPPGPGYTPASIPTSELSLLSHPPTDTIFSSSSPPALTSSPVSVLRSPASVLRSPLSDAAAAATASPMGRMSPLIYDAYVEDVYPGGGFPPMRMSPMSA